MSAFLGFAHLLLVLATAAPAGEGPEVAWRGKRIDAGVPPADLPAEAKAALAEWSPWAKEAGYRMDFDAAARVLLLSGASRSTAERAMPIIESAESWFDALLPSVKGSAPAVAVAASKPAAKKAAPKPSAEPIPEDPESAPPVLEPPKGAQGKTTGKKTGPAKKTGGDSEEGAAWGSGSHEPDSRTIVFIALADEKDQESVLGYLASKHPDLKSWAATAGRDVGFVVENPLLGSFVEAAEGQEEWNPEHEILNRVVRLLTLSRFGQVPNWLVHAVAWEAETARDGSIWVYPYRNEFVYTTEHTSWMLELAHEHEERGTKKPLEIEELTRWTRGTWNGSSARQAFGLVHFLAATKKASLPGVLADFHALWDEGNRKAGEDGTWTRDRDWAPPASAQLAILKGRCGEGVLADTSAWLAKQGTSKGRKAATEVGGKTQAKRN